MHDLFDRDSLSKRLEEKKAFVKNAKAFFDAFKNGCKMQSLKENN